MTTTNPDWSAASAAIEWARCILIVTHVKPDGDAIGSMVGLANALAERGKKVDAAVDGGVPDHLAFIPGAGQVRWGFKRGRWDVMISVDASDEERSGDAGMYGRQHSQIIINLDHHATNTYFGDIHLILSEAASSAEVVYEWLACLNHPLSLQVAVPLLVGIVTDTIGFRTSNVTPATLGVAQRLMAAGASLPDIITRTLNNTSYSMIELWKQVFPSINLNQGVISAVVTQGNLQRANLRDLSDAGRLVGLLASVNEAVIAAVFKELEDGRVEMSFRAKPGFDVARVAFQLGGGGHKQAAGATIDGPLDVAQARVLPLLEQAAVQGAPALT